MTVTSMAKKDFRLPFPFCLSDNLPEGASVGAGGARTLLRPSSVSLTERQQVRGQSLVRVTVSG